MPTHCRTASQPPGGGGNQAGGLRAFLTSQTVDAGHEAKMAPGHEEVKRGSPNLDGGSPAPGCGSQVTAVLQQRSWLFDARS